MTPDQVGELVAAWEQVSVPTSGISAIYHAGDRLAAALTAMQERDWDLENDMLLRKLDEAQATIKRLEGAVSHFKILAEGRNDTIATLTAERDKYKRWTTTLLETVTEADLWEWYHIYEEKTKTIATLTAERDRFIAERDEAVEVGKRTIRTLTAERDMWANRHLRPEYEWATLTAERDAWKATAENNAMIAEERWQRVKKSEEARAVLAETSNSLAERVRALEAAWKIAEPSLPPSAFKRANAALKPSGEE